ncbi:MAG: peptidyl-prolyl cis-trans isomerase [Polyangiales bacterium]
MKWPLVHFALLGLLLFISARWLFPSERVEPGLDTRVVVSESRVAALVSQYEATSGMAATDDVRTELVQRFAEEEMLCREARRWGLTENNQAIDLRLRQNMAFVVGDEHSDEELERQARALGLDSNDAVIRNMLVHNMRLLLSTKGEREPSDADVEAYYERERKRFTRPSRITGWHIFFSKDLRRSSTMEAAWAAKAELDAQALDPETAVALGDPFPSGSHFKGQLARQLSSRFGDEFAKTAEQLPERQWSEPIETPFGAHLVLVEDHSAEKTPPLAEIRGRVAAAYKSSQRHERLTAAMEELRARYEIVVE